MPLALEAQGLKHWTTRGVPRRNIFLVPTVDQVLNWSWRDKNDKEVRLQDEVTG